MGLGLRPIAESETDLAIAPSTLLREADRPRRGRTVLHGVCIESEDIPPPGCGWEAEGHATPDVGTPIDSMNKPLEAYGENGLDRRFGGELVVLWYAADR